MLTTTDLCLGDVMDRHVLTVSSDCTLAHLVQQLRHRHVSQVIVEDDSTPAGLLTERDLVRVLHRPPTMTTRVAQVMSAPVVTVPASMAFRPAYVQLCLSRLRHLVVVDEDQKIVGIASERDFLGHVGLELCQSVQRLEPLVDWSISSMDAATPVAQALDRMVHEKRGCIIVSEGGQPVGLFTEHQAPAALARVLDGSLALLGDVMQHCPVIFSTDASVAEVLGQLVSERAGYVIVVGQQPGATGIIAQSKLLESVRASIHVEVANRDMAAEQIRQVRDELQQQLDFSAAVVDAMIDGVSVCHEINLPPYIHFTMWNQAMSRLTGYAMSEINQRGWYQTIYVDPAVQERARQRMARMRLGDNLVREEWVITRKDGQQRVVEISTSLVMSAGAAPHVMAVMHDVTERKTAETELLLTRNRLESTIEALPDVMVEVDEQAHILGIHLPHDGAISLSVKDYLGKQFSEFLPSDISAQIEQALDESRRHGRSSGTQIALSLQGKSFWFELSILHYASGVDGLQRFVILARDITSRERTERQLRDSESNFREFFNTIDDFLFVLDVTGNILFVNKTVIDRLGYSASSLLGQSVLNVHPPARREEAGRIVGAMLAGKEAFCPVPLIAADGKLIPVETRVVPGIWNGEPALFGVSRDVTERVRIAEALQNEADRRKILFEQSRDGIALLRTDGRLAECNPAFAESLGYTLEELAGMHVWDWDDALQRHELEHEFNKPGRHHLTLETRHRRKNGSLFEVEVSVNDVEWAGERYLFCFHQDITARKQVQEQLRESEFFLLESQRIGQLGGFRADLKRNSVIWTEGVYNICELPSDFKPDLQLALDAYVGLSRDLVVANLQRVLETGASFSIEVQVRGARTGQIKWAELRGFPHLDADGGVDYVMGTLQDISERKRVEEVLARAKEDAEAANRAKSAFLATMSHEIRTPMNGVLGMAQLLLMPNLSESDRYSYARTILNSGQTLLTLLNDILDLSKIEAGKFQLDERTFDPKALVRETQTLFAGAAQAKRLQFESRWLGADDQRYASDPLRIRQMLSNLVGNAIKFTSQGTVQIEGSEVMRDAKTAVLEFSVTDSGIGIAAEKFNLLFKPFSQTDSSTTREFGGSGLGLSIVWNLAKAMGGEAGVESQPEVGSRFWFRIRANLADDSRDSRHGERGVRVGLMADIESANFSGQVLVVEDNPVNCMVIDAMLTGMGMHPTIVHDGQQALDALKRDKFLPDLILMDIHMPVMDGYSATQHIRQWEASEQRASLPIVALTADAFEEDHQRCLSVGMNDFLTKPISIDALRRVLRRLARQTLADQPAATPLSSTVVPFDQTRFTGLVDDLIPLLERNGFDALGKLDELQRFVAGTHVESGVREVGERLQTFRFDLALARLREVVAQQSN